MGGGSISRGKPRIEPMLGIVQWCRNRDTEPAEAGFADRHEEGCIALDATFEIAKPGFDEVAPR